MSAKLTATKNYDLFEVLLFNRDVTKTKKLEASMRKHGYISAYPLHVIRNGNGKLRVKAGNHRLEVARRLGIAVFYVICDDTATIHELEGGTNPWRVHDYLVSFIRCGFAPYIKVKEYMDRTGISLQHCITLLGGHTAGSNNFYDAFKMGTYRIGDTSHAELVGDIVVLCKQTGATVATNSYFVQALSHIARVPEFDENQFISRVTSNLSLMQKQPNVAAYGALIEHVYNRHSQQKVPLVFRSQEIARQRSATQ